MTRLLHQPFGLLHRPMGGLRSQVGLPYADKVIDYLGSSNVIQYLKMDEASGTNADDSSVEGNDGTYSGNTLANLALPSAIGGKAPYFDGVNDYTSLYSAGFVTDWDANCAASGSLFLWFKPPSGFYSDATARQLLNIRAGGSGYINIIKNGSISDRIQFQINGDVAVRTIYATGLSSEAWTMVGMSWDTAADEMRAYYNGQPDDNNPVSGWGTYTGSPAEITTILGGYQTTIVSFIGHIAHFGITKTVITPAQFLQLYNWGIGA